MKTLNIATLWSLSKAVQLCCKDCRKQERGNPEQLHFCFCSSSLVCRWLSRVSTLQDESSHFKIIVEILRANAIVIAFVITVTAAHNFASANAYLFTLCIVFEESILRSCYDLAKHYRMTKHYRMSSNLMCLTMAAVVSSPPTSSIKLCFHRVTPNS